MRNAALYSQITPALVLAFTPTIGVAANWTDLSVTYLKGHHYQVGDPDRQVITLEVAAGRDWGDSFLFVDRLDSDNGSKETYFEWGARYSLQPYFSIIQSIPYLHDVLLAGQWESGTLSTDQFSNRFDNTLWGLGFSWSVPGFKYFNTNIYQRNNEQSKNNQQLTITFAYPITVHNLRFLVDGFWDITNKTDDNSSASSNLTTQWKWDVGHSLWSKPHQLYLGIEYAYWRNKFNLKNVDEKNSNLLLKWHF